MLVDTGNIEGRRVPKTPKTGQGVTMRDVAKAAGVSRMTVSRALRKDSPISRETREKILAVVRDLNYVPDQMAGSLATKRSGFVAALLPSLNNLHFAQTVQALTDDLQRFNLQILLGHTDYDAAREEELVEAMLRRRPEAIVLSYDGHTDRTRILLEAADVPVVEIWERPDAPLGHTVGFSNRDAARQMTEALIARGYRQITFLGEAQDDWTRGAARREGYLQAMAAAGLATDRLVLHGKPPMSTEMGAEITPELLRSFPDTDCIFCVSDAPAFGVLNGLAAAGRRVPEQIGVAGFGNFEVSRFAVPAITTVVVDPLGIGRAAGALITRLLDPSRDAPDPHHIEVGTTLSFRASTRQPTR